MFHFWRRCRIITKKRFKIKEDPRMEIAEPGPFVRGSLLSKSNSEDFHEAKREWILNDIVDESSEGFTDHCDLCNTPHLKHNFVIFNPLTNQLMRVGSKCILRFGIVSGNVDVGSGILLLQNFADEKYYIDMIQTAISSVIVLRPERKELMTFHNNLKKVFELKGISSPSIHQIGELCYGSNWNNVSLDISKVAMLRRVWENPGSIDTYIAKQASRLPVFREHTTLGHKKRTGTVFSLSSGRSEYYDVEKTVTGDTRSRGKKG